MRDADTPNFRATSVVEGKEVVISALAIFLVITLLRSWEGCEPILDPIFETNS